MSKNFKDLKIGLDEDLEEKLQWLVPDYSSYRILKKSLDARKGKKLQEIYSVEVFEAGEQAPKDHITLERVAFSGKPVIVVGSGPAGLFAALRLVERGVPCILLERGMPTEKRMLKINRFWRYGELDSENNVCFGEGGAGMYSDGKLITRIKSQYIPYVMERLVVFGAPEEIKYLANPHVGSDRIRRLIPKMRKHLQDAGCDIRFEAKVTDLLTEGSHIVGVEINNSEKIFSDHVILATGHSANDIYEICKDREVAVEGKSFAVGVRVEHPQEVINKIQYREHFEHPKLGAANYKLTANFADTDVGVYSFCMCPGGYVLSSGTEPDAYVCNGMSNYRRNSPFANSAIVVSIDYEKSFGTDPWEGLKFRRNLENKAYLAVSKKGGKRELPVQDLFSFLDKGKIRPPESFSSPSGVVASDLHEVLGVDLSSYILKAFEAYDKKMHGFISKQAHIYGVESRTSSPLRIVRDKISLQSISHSGLYPCGEGAGYAGGITSAAVDGIRIVEKILES